MWGKEFEAIVCLSKKGVGVCLVERGVWKTTAMTTHWFPVPAESEAQAGLEAALSLVEEICGWLSGRVGTSCLMVRILLPDPVLQHRTLLMQELPASSKQRDALIFWRLKHELEVADENFVFVSHVLSAKAQPTPVYASVLPCELRDRIVQPFMTMGWSVIQLSSWAQSLSGWLSGDRNAPAVLNVYLFEDYWISMRMLEGVPTQVRCRWDAADGSADMLRRDIARAINEEGIGKVRFFAEIARHAQASELSGQLQCDAVEVLTISDLEQVSDRAEQEALRFALAEGMSA